MTASISIPADTARSLLSEHFNLTGTLSALPSERDCNYHVDVTDGSQWVLKIARASEGEAVLTAQCDVMQALTEADFPYSPTLKNNTAGKPITRVDLDNESLLIRLISYLPGIPVGEVDYHSPALLEQIGTAVAQFDKALINLKLPALTRDFQWDLAQAPAVIERNLSLLSDDNLREQVARCLQQHSAQVLPVRDQLPISLIHNDANDYNLLVAEHSFGQAQQLTGLIDLGDMVCSHTVNDLAIAIAYAVLDKPDPLLSATALCCGYHAERPLSDAEFQVLYPLVCLRLAVSACIAAEQIAADPDNEYLAISQAPIQRTLPVLLALPCAVAEAHFRQACGLRASPRNDTLQAWIQEQQPQPLLGFALNSDNCCTLDLGAGSHLIHGDLERNSAGALGIRIRLAMAQRSVMYGVGGYGEARTVYQSDAFAAEGEGEGERRTVHLGLDVWCPAGTAIHAPLDASVALINDNDAQLDYGPVVILRHLDGEGAAFYSLYGHLSRDTLEGLKVGQSINAGQAFATVGNEFENGNWPPHLHFQIINDLLDLGVDYPGVARPALSTAWLAFSPNPSHLAGLPLALRSPQPRNLDDSLEHRQRRLGGALSIAYQRPLKMVRGWRQYLYGHDATRYIDAYNNVCHVGHAHPRVVEVATRQMGTLNTNTRYLHDEILQFSDELCATLPEPLSVCFFVSSGSEANELAMRIARASTGQRDMLVLDAAYHGNTTGLIDISPYKHDGPGGYPRPEWVHKLPIPDVYRARLQDHPDPTSVFVSPLDETLARLAAAGRGPAAYIAESCPSVGGQVVPPPGYLAAVYERVRAAGGVCIADEVQTGYGRMGDSFYAFESQGVVPDMVVLGKPIGNGHPLAAVITTPALAEAFNNGMEYFATFGGNPVSCAVGREVLQIVHDEDLQAHARDVGQHLLTGLRSLQEHCALIGDVRGKGLFLGMELVREHETLEPADTEATFVVNRLRDHGILAGTDGPFHNVVKIRPPMPFGIGDAERLLQALASIMR